MTRVYFIGDLHFGHNNIHKFRSDLQLSSEEAHREFLIDRWNSTINKRDVVWLLGDICFKRELIPQLDRLRGHKYMVLGNHDLNGKFYSEHVNKVCGVVKYKGLWLSHAPIHPAELRGSPNVHGHVHSQTLEDTANYFNASCENISYRPVSLECVMEALQEGRKCKE